MKNIKLLIFDLDGVLLDCKHIHASAFINTWNSIYEWISISHIFHEKYLDGRNTYGKIEYLENYFNIKVDCKKVYTEKQIYTKKELNSYNYPTKFKKIFESLKEQNILLACASNSIRETVEIVLNKLDIYKYFDLVLTNEDVKEPKPSPEIYNKVMTILNVLPENTIIFEDSPIGLEAATKSKAIVIKVKDSVDLNYLFISNFIEQKMKFNPYIYDPNWKLRIIVPMAGEGSRFRVEGYTISKPFIPIQNKPMIMWVLDNFKSKYPELQSRIEYHLCVRSEYVNQFNDLSGLIIHSIPQLTEGPACTVLNIKEIINNDYPILMANSDQYLEWDFDEFIEASLNPYYDGCISTFNQPDPTDLKWSYAKIDENGIVTKVAEKEYISSNATTGIYFWKSGRNFIKYAETMIRNNDRVKNEFYVGPVYNYAIQDNNNIRILDCKKMWGLGVPNDLKKFIQDYLKE